MGELWRRHEAHVSHAPKWALDPMVAAHYLHVWPAVVVCRLAMWADGAGPVGMVIFAAAPRESSVRYGGQTWELARLWIEDSVARNAESWLIGQAVRHVRREHPEVRCLVSYADPTQGHHGTIYRAANWRYDGMTDQERQTPRSDYVPVLSGGLLFGEAEGAKVGRRSHLSGEVHRKARSSKHRYFLPLALSRQPRSLWGAA